MGLLDSVLGGLMGGGSNSALSPILAEVLGGQGSTAPGTAPGSMAGANTQPGLAGLVERFVQAGHGNTVNSWVGNGPNQAIEPSALQQVFGQGQINQWSQQTGMAPHDLLGQLAQFLPAAIDRMTPNGSVQQGGPAAQETTQSSNPFDGPGAP